MRKFIYKMHSGTIKAAREEADRKITAAVKSVFLQVGKEWQAKYPKRNLQLVAGMGSVFWVIDGEILHTDNENGTSKTTWEQLYKNELNYSWKRIRCGYWVESDRLMRRIMEPLLTALEWLNDEMINGEYLDHYLSDIKSFK